MDKVNTNVTNGELQSKILDLMFKDGFGVDEALADVTAYCEEIFIGGATPTAIQRTTTTLNRIEREAERRAS